jgi:hypothetical protein
LIAFRVLYATTRLYLMFRLQTLVPIAALLAVCLSAMSACETAPPVQEMSDARQAIAVAREAGPNADAARELESAEDYLESAEQQLNQRNYSQARDAALEAKARALRSLKMSESTSPPPYN